MNSFGKIQLLMSVILTCVCLFSVEASATCIEYYKNSYRQERLNSNFSWPEAKYQDYLRWLRTEFRGYQTCHDCVFNIDLILNDSHLTRADLSSIRGRILLAGEGPITGDGLYNEFVRTRGSAADVIALDISYKDRSGSLVEGSVTKMPFEDESFNFIVSHMVAHYLREKKMSYSYYDQNSFGMAENKQGEFIQEVVRVLAPGGEARIGPFKGYELKALLNLGNNQASFTPIEIKNGGLDGLDGYVLVIKKNK